MLFTLHARLRVRRHPAFPTPFSWKGGEFSHNSDAFAPRERGRVCSPRRMPIDVVIASAAKQSSFLLSLTMDCFAALAMTLPRAARRIGPCVRRDDTHVLTATATHHPSSPRTRGPTTIGSSLCRCRPTASLNTSDTAYGSLRPQGRHRCSCRDATHHPSSPRTRGPITTGSSLCRCPRTASLNTSDTAYGSLRPQGRHRCSCRDATHHPSSPRTRGPITIGSSLCRCRPTASLNTSDTAYGSLRPQGRHRCSCRDATHHPSSPRTRGPITTGSSLCRCPRTASLNTSDTAYGSLRPQGRHRCSCRDATHHPSSPRTRGP